MTKEQAIKNLFEIVELSKDEIKSGNTNIAATLDYEDLKSLQIALDMIKENSADIEEYKRMIAAGIINAAKDELVQEKNKELEKKDKIIDLIINAVYRRFKAELLLEYGFENEEQFKQYFEKIATNNG